MIRHLPPVAPALEWVDWQAGWRAQADGYHAFAEELASYLDVSACFLAASGRTALYVLLTALKSRRDSQIREEVIIPAYTCPVLVKVTQDAGLRPVLVDVAPETLDYEPEELAASLSWRTLAVFYVHPFGIPQPVQTIIEAAHRVGAVVIEDAAQALGSRIDGKLAGTWGDFGLYSFGPGKPLSTGGGGAISANEPWGARLAETFWQDLPRPGSTTSLVAQIRLGLFRLAFHPAGWWLATRLGAQRVGNYEASWGYQEQNMSRAQAQVGTALLPKLEDVNAVRKANAELLLKAVEGIGGLVRPRVPGSAEPIYLRLPLLAGDFEHRERLWQALQATGISAGRMYEHSLATLFPAITSNKYLGAEAVAERLLTLPTHHFVREEDVRRMAEIMRANCQVTAGV